MDRVVEVLRENELAVMTRTVVDEMEFPEFIVMTLGPFPTERVFKYDEFVLAESYYNHVGTYEWNRLFN
jgi:hypothetical protein